MLDFTLFNVNVSPVIASVKNSLILSGCNVTILKNIHFSEFEELNFYPLNSNFDFGIARIELRFEKPNFNPYTKFRMGAVTICLDNKYFLKSNCGLELDNHTKITKDGKFALGIDYYFEADDEYLKFKNCTSFCFEGSIIFKKHKIYNFMCLIKKDENSKWVMEAGNTYRTNNVFNKSFVH